MKERLTFTVSIPTDNGFIGRACHNPDCEQYFKLFADLKKRVMFCPYCGSRFSDSELHTKDQVKYINEAVAAEAVEYAQNELQKVRRIHSVVAQRENLGLAISRVE